MSLIKNFHDYLTCKSHILNYKNLSVKNNVVNLHYYHSELEKGKDFASNNLGDELSPVIFDFMCKYYNVNNLSKIKTTQNLYSLGSIIFMGFHNATIWGSGVPYEPFFKTAFFHRSFFRKLDIRCVRGPVTKKILEKLGHKCPEAYGDPAVLLPLIYKSSFTTKKRKFLFIPHYSTENLYLSHFNQDDILSMNTNDYKSVVDKICSSEKVISTSLHGIILAESYGIPAIFMQDRAKALNCKYEDWYESTNRALVVSHSVEDAKKINVDIPDLSDMRNTLMNTFPFDLFDDYKIIGGGTIV